LGEGGEKRRRREGRALGKRVRKGRGLLAVTNSEAVEFPKTASIQGRRKTFIALDSVEEGNCLSERRKKKKEKGANQGDQRRGGVGSGLEIPSL